MTARALVPIAVRVPHGLEGLGEERQRPVAQVQHLPGEARVLLGQAGDPGITWSAARPGRVLPTMIFRLSMGLSPWLESSGRRVLGRCPAWT